MTTVDALALLGLGECRDAEDADAVLRPDLATMTDVDLRAERNAWLILLQRCRVGPECFCDWVDGDRLDQIERRLDGPEGAAG